MSKPLKAAIIGLGVGERHINGYESHPECEVKTICDFDENKLSEVSKRYPGKDVTRYARDIFNDDEINIVSVASFDNYHSEQVMSALNSNKNVFVEKPLCLHRNEYKEILETLRRNPNLKISSNLILRKTPRFIQLKNRVSKNKLGKPYLFESSYDYGRLNKILDGWRGDIPFYSVTHGGGIHLIDLMMWISGNNIIKVIAKGNNISTKETNFRHYDCVQALLTFEDGSIGHVISNYSSVTPHGHKLSIYGTKGTFHHGPLGCCYFWNRNKDSEREIINDPYPGTQKGDIIPSFVDHILNKDIEPLVTTKSVLNTMTVSLAIEESLNTGREVIVPYPII